MDLKEPDIEARVAKLYIDFDTIVDDHGPTAMVGGTVAQDEQGRIRMKLRYKLLMKLLEPKILHIDLARLASLTHPHVKRDDIALYDLIMERAMHQQHFHQMAVEVNQASNKKKSEDKSVDREKAGDRPPVSGSAKPGTPCAPSQLPRGGCCFAERTIG
jgi:hypothetical protein